MKKILKLIPVLFIIFAFQTDDLIEIESSLNARTSANFHKTTQNVRATLVKGTTGKVLETIKLPSGNFGIKIKVQSGKYRDEVVWVYHNLKNSNLKLSDQNHQETSSVDEAKQARAKRDIASIIDPDKTQMISAVNDVVHANKLVRDRKILIPNVDCKLNQGLSDPALRSTYNVEMDIEPFKEFAEAPLESMACNSNDAGYTVCRTSEGIPQKFSLDNKGGNSIVAKNEYYINRTFEFESNDLARSDMTLTIVDAPDEYTSHATYSVMVFLPRSVLPSVKKSGDELIVTLPTKEKVYFNSKTKEITGGVFTEGPMVQDERKKAKPANVKYRGKGVLIRADKSGDLPIGDTERSDGTRLPSSSTAVISKEGYPDCKIPAKEIWYTDYNKKGNVFIKRELATDILMDQFLRKRCGFSIF